MSMESIVECCTVDLVGVGVDAVSVVLVDEVGLNEILLVVDVGFGVEVLISCIVVALVIVVDFVVAFNVVFHVVIFIEVVVLGISNWQI